MTCWRGECQRGCYYPDACSEGALQARAEAAETRVAEFQRNALEMARKADIAEAERDAALAEVERLRGRVEEAEFHVRQVTEARDRAERQAEALKAAAEKVGHQAVCPVDPCDCWMLDLTPLLDDCPACDCGVDGYGKCPCGCDEPPGLCSDCGHIHTTDGCSGPPTPSDVWAGVSPAACDCDAAAEIFGTERLHLCEGCGVELDADDGHARCEDCEADELPECLGICGEHYWLDRPESDTRECLICGTEVAG